MSMGELDGADAEEIAQRAYQEGAAAAMRDVAHLLPKAEKPDMFADPEGYERYLLDRAAQERNGGFVPPAPPHGYGQGAPKPDMFADPEGYERWMINEIGRRANIDQFHADRVNSSMKYAHDRHGPEFEAAYNDIAHGLDPRSPQHQQLVRDILNSPDPGLTLMGAANLAHAANANALHYGSSRGANPVFAPGLMPRREPLRNSEGLPPRSREEAQEIDVFNDVFRDGTADIWSGF
jgi:hypothetical protein